MTELLQNAELVPPVSDETDGINPYHQELTFSRLETQIRSLELSLGIEPCFVGTVTPGQSTATSRRLRLSFLKHGTSLQRSQNQSCRPEDGHIEKPSSPELRSSGVQTGRAVLSLFSPASGRRTVVLSALQKHYTNSGRKYLRSPQKQMIGLSP